MGKYITFKYADGTKYGITGLYSVVTVMYEDIDLNPIHAAKVGTRHPLTRLLDGSFVSSGIADNNLQCNWRISSTTIFDKIHEIIRNEKFSTVYIDHPIIDRYAGIWNVSAPTMNERNYLIWELQAQLFGPMKRWRYHWYGSELFSDYDIIRMNNTTRELWDFEEADEDTAAELVSNFNWVMENGTWSEDANEGPLGTGDNAIKSPGAGVSELFVFGPSWISDMILQVQVKIETGDNQAGVVFRFKDTDNYYLLQIAATQDTIGVWKLENGGWTELVLVDQTIDVETYYTLRIETSANHFKIYLDGILMINLYDNTFTVGKSGFYAGTSDVIYFDNLRYYLKKPIRIGLPAGFIGVNQGVDFFERSTSTDMLGFCIDPVSPLTFDQRVKTLPAKNGTTRLLLHFDEGQGTSVYDHSGNNMVGTFALPEWVTGWNKWFRQCLKFDSTGDIITIPDNSQIDFAAADSFSISFWMYGQRTGVAGISVIRKMVGGTDGYDIIYYNNTGKIGFFIGDGSFFPYAITNDAISDTGWSHIVCVRDVGLDKLYIYVNGVLASDLADDTTTGTLVNADPLYISGTSTADVLLDEIEIRAEVISGVEAAGMWRNRNIGAFGGGDILVWDTDADERVYHWDHTFADNVDVSNGMIKYSIRANDGQIQFEGWDSGAYLTSGVFRFRFYLVEEATTLISDAATSWSYKIRELGPDRCIIRMYYDYEPYGISGMVDISLRKGNRHVLFDFSMNSERFHECAAELVSSLDYRFIGVPHSPPGTIEVMDAEFNSTDNIEDGVLEDNFIVVFEENTTNDLILSAFCTDDPALKSDSDNIAPFGQIATSSEFTHIRAYTERRQVGFALTPYDISDLFHEGSKRNNGTDTADGAASDGSAWEGSVNGDGAYFDVSGIEPGAHIMYVRARFTSTGEMRMRVRNVSEAATLAELDLTATGTYAIYGLEFIIDEDDVGDTIFLEAYRLGSGTYRIDYLGYYPLSNSKDFPGDIAHQGLRKIQVNRSGEMD